jgi:predicted transcriptional regulator
MTTISALMTRGPLVTVGPEAWVADATKLLADAGISHLMVTADNETLLGVMCVCDLDRVPLGTQLKQHMHVAPVTVEADTEAEIALTIMTSRQVSCLPVLENGRLSGVVTLSDLRRGGLAAGGEERCSACGGREHVRCSHGRSIGLCIECTRIAEPPDGDEDPELGGGD